MEEIMSEKDYIAERVNRNCTRASCFVCAEADKYEDYTQCPFLPLKTITRERPVTAEDVTDDMIKK